MTLITPYATTSAFALGRFLGLALIANDPKLWGLSDEQIIRESQENCQGVRGGAESEVWPMRALRSLAILIFGTRWLCWHSVIILRWDQSGRMWTMCLDCGHESKGVQVRGPELA